MVGTQLLIKIYGSKERAIHSAEILIENELKELEAKAEVSISKDDWLALKIDGDDAEFAANFLVQKYGTPTTKTKNGSDHKGFVHKIEEDKIEIDIGMIVTIPKDELNFFGAGNAQQMAARFGIIRYLPVEVEMIDAGELKARFTKKQADAFWELKKSKLDHVVANSVTKSELKAAIKKTRHGRDIHGIERLGLMEHMITCKEGTDGPGIVAAIGKYINGDFTSFEKMKEDIHIQKTLSNLAFNVGEHDVKLTQIELLHRPKIDEIRCEVISTGILSKEEKSRLREAILQSIHKKAEVIVTFRYKL